MHLICRECGETAQGDVLGGAVRDEKAHVVFTVHIQAQSCEGCGAQSWMPYLVLAPSDEELLNDTEAASGGDIYRLQCTWCRILHG